MNTTKRVEISKFMPVSIFVHLGNGVRAWRMTIDPGLRAADTGIWFSICTKPIDFNLKHRVRLCALP